jgi:Zn-dependent M28 family amino/carboxypeptidase
LIRNACPAALSVTIAAALPLLALAASDPLQTAARGIDGAEYLRHVQTLSSDDFEGRAPGTRGEKQTVEYLKRQFEQLGLKSANPDGSYTQVVPMAGYTADPHASYSVHGKAVPMRCPEDFVAFAPRKESPVRVDDSPLVFVGYGIRAPEYGWDDYKGANLKGKTLVMLINDPPLPDPKDPHRLDKKMFGGRAMTYYGRWTYKYEMAVRQGAAAAIIVHETVPATYPWSVLANGAKTENLEINSDGPSDKYPKVAAWMTRPQAEKLFAASGRNFEALKQAALSKNFKPVDLGATVNFKIDNRWRDVSSHNVVATLPGSDPKLQHEYVVYTAHWDHFGWDPALHGSKTQQIYHGARDNASGVAALLVLAKAFKSMPIAPKRSVVFIITTGEESGLLGAGYYARHPLYPLRNTVASINVDEMPTRGRTRELELVTAGKSSVDETVRIEARTLGIEIVPSQQPEMGSFYRGDHLEFARMGVPVAYLSAGKQVIGKPADYGTQQEEAYNDHDYHQVSDTVKSDWDLGGATQDLELLLRVGYALAEDKNIPQWYPDAEFKAVRDAAFSKQAN